MEATAIEPGAPTACVDWLTFSAPKGDSDALVETAGYSICYSEADSGGIPRQAGQQGYRGLTAGGAFFGERHDGYLLVLRGEAAARHARRCVGLPGKPTRLDLAVNWRSEYALPDYVRDAYGAWCRMPKGYNQARRAELIQENTGGATLYVGAKSSAVRVRLYDHGHRHGYDQPGFSFRWEAQLRHEYARSHWSELVECDLAAVAQAGMVYALASDRQLPLPWSVDRVSVDTDRRGATDIERKLDWLRKSVAPTVATLMSLGEGERVLAALGLDGVT